MHTSPLLCNSSVPDAFRRTGGQYLAPKNSHIQKERESDDYSISHLVININIASKGKCEGVGKECLKALSGAIQRAPFRDSDNEKVATADNAVRTG